MFPEEFYMQRGTSPAALYEPLTTAMQREPAAMRQCPCAVESLNRPPLEDRAMQQ